MDHFIPQTKHPLYSNILPHLTVTALDLECYISNYCHLNANHTDAIELDQRYFYKEENVCNRTDRGNTRAQQPL